MIASKKKSSHSYSKFLLPIFVIVGIVSIFFWKVIIKGYVPLPADFAVGVYYPWLDYKWGYDVGVPVKNPITTDVVSFIYPMQTLAIELMKNGEWPLWNPYILGGAPLLANFQSAPFSPTNFIYFLTNNVSAWSIQIMLQHVFAALFTYILLRHWKVSIKGSLLGGVVFAFTGYNLIWSQWNGHTLSASFIPLYLYFFDRFLKNQKYIDGVGVSITLALQILSGYPQVVLYTAVAAGVLWIVNFSKSKKFILNTVILLIFSAISIGLTAYQVLPGAELLAVSQREIEPHPYDWAFLPWSKIITFVAPDYFGNHSTQNYWGPQDYTSNTGFVGVVSLTLAVIALLKLKNREIRYAALLSLASLLLSFPTFASIFLWKSGMFGLQAASAHRALVLWNLGIAILVGFGIDVLFAQNKKRLLSLIPSALILFFTLAITAYYYKITLGNEALSFYKWIPKYTVGLRNLVFPIAVLFAVSLLVYTSKFKYLQKIVYAGFFVLMTLELFRFGWKFTPIVQKELVYPTTPVIDFLQNQEKPVRITGFKVIPINMRMPYKLESLEGYDAIYPLNIARFLAVMNSGNANIKALGRYGTVDNDTSPLMDMTNTKFYLTLKRDEKGNPNPEGEIPNIYSKDRFSVAFEDKTTVVLESKNALPRAFLVNDWEVITDDTQQMEKLLDSNYPFSEKIVLSTEPSLIKTSDASNSRVDVLSYETHQSAYKVETEKDALLFVSDTFYPGWEAYIDGKLTQIKRANFAFRSVEVPAGSHTVEFKYRPRSFFYGINIALLSLSFLVIFRLIYKRFINNE